MASLLVRNTDQGVGTMSDLEIEFDEQALLIKTIQFLQKPAVSCFLV